MTRCDFVMCQLLGKIICYSRQQIFESTFGHISEMTELQGASTSVIYRQNRTVWHLIVLIDSGRITLLESICSFEGMYEL